VLEGAPSDLVMSITPDLSSAQLYNRILAEAGFRAKSITPDQIQSLRAEPAGVIIIDGSIHQAPANLADMLNRRPLERTRIIAMVPFGVELLKRMEPGTVLADVEGDPNDPVIFGSSNLPADLTTGLPMSAPFNLYSDTPRNVRGDVAVYDSHSLAALGAFGIVRRTTPSRFPCAGSYWPVVQQNRYVLWGYADDPENLTTEGKRLLANLVKYLQVDQATKFREAEVVEATAVPPLHYSDKLECTGTAPVDEQLYPFIVGEPGTIRIEVQSQAPLDLILNGPGRLNAYARVKAVSPELDYNVTKQDVGRGAKWIARVVDFDLKPGGRVPYRITIDYPPLRKWHPFLWAGVGIGGLVLFGMVTLRSLKRIKEFWLLWR